jgi:hypothetical protein
VVIVACPTLNAVWAELWSQVLIRHLIWNRTRFEASHILCRSIFASLSITIPATYLAVCSVVRYSPMEVLVPHRMGTMQRMNMI